MGLLLFGVFMFIVGILFAFLALTPQDVILGLLLFGFFALPFLIW